MTEIPLMAQLEAWATGRNLRPSGFGCELYKSCDSSTHNKLRRGETVCMSYVGSRYGQTDTKPQVRLVLVGKEHRPDEGGTDFADRQRGIISGYQRQAEKFNPHYRGVVRTAAAVFGSRMGCLLCVQQGACQSSASKDRSCVLDMFAQPNLVKCAWGPNATSRTTNVMRVNCTRWLLEELELLKPTLIIFHDRHAQWVLKQAYETHGWTQATYAGDRTGFLYEVAKGSFRADVLYLHHPSRGWMNRQWGNVVEPALASLRGAGRIPG